MLLVINILTTNLLKQIKIPIKLKKYYFIGKIKIFKNLIKIVKILLKKY